MDSTASNVPSVEDAPTTPRRTGRKGCVRIVPGRGARSSPWTHPESVLQLLSPPGLEQRRAADAGLAAVEVVGRVVEVVRVEKVVESVGCKCLCTGPLASSAEWVATC